MSIITVLVGILFLALIIPQIIYWMTYIAKYRVRQKNKLLLQEYKQKFLKTLDMDKKQDDDIRGYA